MPQASGRLFSVAMLVVNNVGRRSPCHASARYGSRSGRTWARGGNLWTDGTSAAILFCLDGVPLGCYPARCEKSEVENRLAEHATLGLWESICWSGAIGSIRFGRRYLCENRSRKRWPVLKALHTINAIACSDRALMSRMKVRYGPQFNRTAPGGLSRLSQWPAS